MDDDDAVVVATSAADRRAAGTSETSSAGIIFVAVNDFKPFFVICEAAGANAAQVGSMVTAATATEDIENIAIVVLLLLFVATRLLLSIDGFHSNSVRTKLVFVDERKKSTD